MQTWSGGPHASSMGVHYTTKTARDIMYTYRPYMYADLAEAVQCCNICQEFLPCSWKQRTSHDIPTSKDTMSSSCQWLFRYQQSTLLCNSIPLLRLRWTVPTGRLYLQDTNQEHEAGLCQLRDTTTVDINRQCTCKLCLRGVCSWLGFGTHNFNSPPPPRTHPPTHYSRSTGKAESAVKIAKGLVEKAGKEGGDMWKALLEWRNTPTPGMTLSPIQYLMSKRTHSFLPCKNTLYQPKAAEEVAGKVAHRRQRAKRWHNVRARPPPEPVVGQPVRTMSRPKLKVGNILWVAGVIRSQPAPRSRTVVVGDRWYRRNRAHTWETHRRTPKHSRYHHHWMSPLS